MRGLKQKKIDIKRILLGKTDGVCARCGRTLSLEKTTIEHYVPKYRGGADDERNLLPLCKKCNKQKGSRLVDAGEYYLFLKSKYCLEADKYRVEEGISL
jgi:5-methylcytosine-specific restriction endonuclease McrA